MRVKFILALASLLISISAFAQRGKFFSTDNQLLSSSFVTQVYLDNEGFIWATTRNGINRYDGYQFRVFKKENEHDSSLASNYVKKTGMPDIAILIVSLSVQMATYWLDLLV